MKLGILGTGMIVKDVLTMYHELGVEKTYLFSTKKSKSQALELMKKYHLDKVYTDYDELLQSDVDTIYCALPNHLHYEFSKKALENDKNVIIEKPITANSKELEDLIETANKKNLMIFEAMNLHYIPAFLSLKEDLKKLGDIKIVSFNYSQYSSRYNAVKEGTILPAFDFHKAGGALMDLNVYNIHALIDLFGKPVYHKYMANIERNIDTSGMMLFDFEHFKALCIGAKDCKAPLMNTIQGNLGAIVVKCPLSQMTEYEICYNDGTSEVKSFEKKHRLIYEFKAFMKMMEEKDYKNAEVEFQDAVDKKKNLGEAYRGLGLCYWEQKKYEKAEKALEKALKNGTEETATLYNILGICDLELDKPEKAVYYFENGQELSGAGKELLKEMAYNLVVAYEKAGDYQSAKEKLDSYLKANPDDKKALKEQEFLNTQISEGDQQ